MPGEIDFGIRGQFYDSEKTLMKLSEIRISEVDDRRYR